MFTIQYKAVNGEHVMQDFDSKSRVKLAGHLARFEHPIIAVYEQATVITKAMRDDLSKWPGTLTQYAREFAFTIRQ